LITKKGPKRTDDYVDLHAIQSNTGQEESSVIAAKGTGPDH